MNLSATLTNLVLILSIPTTATGQSALNVESGDLTVGQENSLHLRMTHNHIQAFENNSPKRLGINRFGGDVLLGDQLGEAYFKYDASSDAIGIGAVLPATKLHIGGTNDASLNNHGLFLIGQVDGANIVMDQNEIMARNNGSPSTLFLNNNGGTIRAPGLQNIGDHKNMQFNSSTGELGWDNSSRRDKIRIKTLRDDWRKILQARPVMYARPKSPDYLEYGYIAEEIDSLGLTTMVGYDSLGRPDDVRYDKMVIYLVEMLKLQEKEIDNQKSEIVNLRSDLSTLRCEMLKMSPVRVNRKRRKK